MRNLSKILGLILVMGIAFWLGTTFNSQADSAKPGSVDDPLVTKSYVDKLLAQGGAGGGQGAAAGIQTEVVILNPGEVLLAKAGAQFVLRAGKGVAYSSDANGISDVTDGKDILSGQPVANNHLLIFPRDGRGVMPDPKANAPLTVLVMGSYEIAAAPKSNGS
jgi:hypothetical protein